MSYKRVSILPHPPGKYMLRILIRGAYKFALFGSKFCYKIFNVAHLCKIIIFLTKVA